MGYSLGQRLVGTIFAVSLCLANTVAPSFFFFLDGHHLHTLPLPSSRGPEKPRGKLLHSSDPQFLHLVSLTLWLQLRGSL